ncbi:MAG: AzlC family ABC transporter permease [Sphaerochaetaceae bacterium]|nr:AzlC family ABC transporter permease [Sphaerochaetaceae bacterium]
MGNGRLVKEGIQDGFPIFLGYFSTSLAFGLLCRSSGFNVLESTSISMSNFSGSGQFLMINLFNAGSLMVEIVLSVFFLNTRYMFMASSLYQRLEKPTSFWGRMMCGFGTTDEIFTVASFKNRKLEYSYLAGLIFTSYSGWCSGTFIGYLAGNFLPDVIQKAAAITCYAMFASLLGGETRRNFKALIALMISGGVNSFLILVFKLGTGISFLISMLITAVAAAFIYTDEEAGV